MKKIVVITIISLIGIIIATLGGVAIAQGQHIFPGLANSIPSNNHENTIETTQKIKEPIEAISTNSDTDNVSRKEPSPRDLIAGLAENTYVSAEEFGITSLTEQEKADCISIASQHPAVSGFVSRSDEYITAFRWIGLFPGGYGLLPYDTVEKGIPTVLDWTKTATFYPAVGFRTPSYSYVLAVDLNTREVVYVTSGPVRKGPN